MSKLEILVDVDGVCADFLGPVLDTIYEVSGTRYSREDVNGWNIEECLNLDRDDWAETVKEIQSPGFARKLQPLPHAIESVKKLAQQHEVYFVTADWRGSPTWVYDRNHWLTDHFGALGKRTVHTSQKHLISGNVLIEDKPGNIHGWAVRQKGHAILFDAPYNRNEQDRFYFTRVKSWYQALLAISEVKLQ